MMDADLRQRGPHLRLLWPQWQGAGTDSVRSLAPEFPFEVARRGYTLGTKVLQAVLPDHDGPTAVVPVEMGNLVQLGQNEVLDQVKFQGQAAASPRSM